ncbi:MAG: hypothetical protein JHC95_08310 [Solirubrobacteraceae bacterium]|nr:hypothetical protein [Solirubrobacteraceae bacterium]
MPPVRAVQAERFGRLTAWAIAAGLCAVLIPITFVVLHSGALGRRTCGDEGFSGPGTLSLWPPGTECLDEPPVDVLLNPLFVFAVPAIIYAVISLTQLVRHGR